MEVTQENFNWYKDLVIKYAFVGVDPKTVTDDMVKSIISKGWLQIVDKKLTICLKCGGKIKFKFEQIQEEKMCPFCYNDFTV